MKKTTAQKVAQERRTIGNMRRGVCRVCACRAAVEQGMRECPRACHTSIVIRGSEKRARHYIAARFEAKGM